MAVSPKLGLSFVVDEAGVASSTRGFVGDTIFAVLPNVKPVHCFLLTIAMQVVRPAPLPFVVPPAITTDARGCVPASQVFSAKLWFRPSYKTFVWALAISGYTSFLFGWHVHEKAVLLFLVPLRYVNRVRTGRPPLLINRRALCPVSSQPRAMLSTGRLS